MAVRKPRLTAVAVPRKCDAPVLDELMSTLVGGVQVLTRSSSGSGRRSQTQSSKERASERISGR